MIGFFTRSIPRRILASLVAIYVSTYVATAIVVYSSVRVSILESNTSALQKLAELKYERLVNELESLATDVTAWSQLEAMNDLVSGDIDKRVTQTLDGLKKLYGLQGNIFAFNAAGNLLASTAITGAADQIRSLPTVWRTHENHLVFVDKHTDPMSGSQVVALEIPVFGTFDKNFRIGTLVLTYPWAAVETQLFSHETGTLLIETGHPPRALAVDVGTIADRAGINPAEPLAGGTHTSLIRGQSAYRNGILEHWQVQALQDTSVVTRSLRWVAEELILLGMLLGIPIFGLGRWLSNRLTAPVVELTRVVREIADTDKLDARVPVSSSDELGTLARSFNRMTENLERTTGEREQFVRELEALNQTLEAKVAARTAELEAAVMTQHRLIADISHEIKSPLARLDVALGLVRRSAINIIPKQFDRMEREIGNISALASELLTLARLDSAAAIVEFAAVDLRPLVGQIVVDAVYEAKSREADIVLHASGDPIIVHGNADLLRRAIENVVRNAIFYTGERTRIDIVLSSKIPERVAIEVRDQGPGVPTTALDHLFEPFFRVDEARARKTGGSGIGLAICQRVVLLHAGSIRARRNQPHGLIVEIEIPLARRST